jgi:hypothetical protein
MNENGGTECKFSIGVEKTERNKQKNSIYKTWGKSSS